MIEFILKLLIAHILGDFVFQPDHWVSEKRELSIRSKYMYFHLAIHAFFIMLLLAFDTQYWLALVLIVFSHFLIDWLKIALHNKIKERLLFILDQLAHLLVIGMVVYLYHPFHLNFADLINTQLLVFAIAVLLVTYVSAVIIRILMQNWNVDSYNENNSLKNAGKYIGMLERLFVFTFIILSEWQAIGFLIAAKSVFRFGDLSRAEDRKLTEYILIGTLLSFFIAVAISLTYVYFKESFIGI